MRIISKLKTGVLSLMALCSLNTTAQQASDIPLVYEQENSFSSSNHMERETYKALSLDELTPVSQLRNPLQWYNKNEAFIDRFLLGKEADTRNVQLFKP